MRVLEQLAVCGFDLDICGVIEVILKTVEVYAFQFSNIC